MIALIYCLVGAALGLSLHRGLFIHGEWHVRAPQIVSYHLVYFIALLLTITRAHWLIAGYLLAMFFSIGTYLLFFHRLKSFPGPGWARITKVWHAWKARYRQNYLLLAKLHHEYGDFARTGQVNEAETSPPSGNGKPIREILPFSVRAQFLSYTC